MVYEANTHQWEKGDLVVHDCDRKCAGMLMRVVGYGRDGSVRTRYVTPPNRRWKKELRNPLKFLLDPKKFGIDTNSVKTN